MINKLVIHVYLDLWRGKIDENNFNADDSRIQQKESAISALAKLVINETTIYNYPLTFSLYPKIMILHLNF